MVVELLLIYKWHDIMFGGDDASTEVARMWFMAYIFLVTMLCSDLFVYCLWK